MLLKVSGENPEPMYQQIINEIRRLILTGELSPGDPLPSIRELAQQLTTSVITTRRAYLELEREGLLTTRQGVGTFVARVDRETARAAARKIVAGLLNRALEEARRLGLTDEEISAIFDGILQGGNGKP
ncbi:HTH-type transcriptional repressor YtrA [Moorella humiferrea]|uniref:HTH-type transcriptional repressor YtrA n=1 Tax=Neomoorella humiferrea TaxID=676965 RepID=A0A2T0AV96_9FIRM|nr:GntR family transcriptional regulator [Moorella humiferrea]PRR74486.1 HTH-type transcriptional repressor YtrA [Moorella humiferrea]